MKSVIGILQPESNAETKLLNTTVLSVCEAIVDLGGFDEFVKLLDMDVINEYGDDMWNSLRGYIKEIPFNS